MGLIARRLAKHAHDCELAYRLIESHPPDYDLLRPYETSLGDLDPEDVVAEGKALADAMRSGVALPDLSELNFWRARARIVIKIMKAETPEAVATYVERLESKKDRRLIGSM